MIEMFFPETLRKYSEGDLAKIIIEKSMDRLAKNMKVDIIIVGAGPSGLTAAWFLASNKYRVLVVERGLGVGGGIRGGSILLPVALIQEGEALEIIRSAGVNYYSGGADGIYVVDPIETMLKIAVKAIDAGASIWPGVFVEDLITRGRSEELRVTGVLVNWSPVIESGWHVDPLYIEARAVVDATGHDGYLVKLLVKRHPELKLEVPGMSSGNVWEGEREVVERTGMVIPGLYVAGMSVAELYNVNRMGPILGGMLVSGRKVAIQISEDLGKSL